MTKALTDAELVTALAQNGGFTIDPDRIPYAGGGYIVGLGAPFCATVGVGVADSPAVISAIVGALCVKARALNNMVGRRDSYVGGWLDPATGLLHFDISRVFQDRHEALAWARDAGQLAVYDAVLREDIPVSKGDRN